VLFFLLQRPFKCTDLHRGQRKVGMEMIFGPARCCHLVSMTVQPYATSIENRKMAFLRLELSASLEMGLAFEKHNLRGSPGRLKRRVLFT